MEFPTAKVILFAAGAVFFWWSYRDTMNFYKTAKFGELDEADYSMSRVGLYQGTALVCVILLLLHIAGWCWGI